MQVSKELKLLLSEFATVDSETVHLERAASRVLSTNIEAKINLPMFDNSSMDGFAFKSSDLALIHAKNPVSLKVVADIPAGVEPNRIINKGEAGRIVTGAMMPKGADAVVPVEDTNFGRFKLGSDIPESVCV